MKYVIWGLVVLLIVLHQDNWFWDRPTLVFGFMPVGLLYHVGISLAAGIVWCFAIRYCWPHHLDQTSAAEGDGRSET